MSGTVDGESRPEDAGQLSAEAEERTWRALKWLGLSLAALVGMAQIGAIVQEVTPDGAFSVTTLYGPGQVVSSLAATSGALDAWAKAAQFGLLPGWLYLHLIFDILFIVGYGGLGFTLLLPRERDPLTWYLLVAVIAADGQEDVAAAVAFTRIIDHDPHVFALTLALHLATAAKWLTVLVFAVRLAFVAWDYARGAIGHAFSALWEQRFSVVVVVLLAVLAASRGPDVFEQMPDVQRSWLTWPAGMGWVHAAVALAAQLLLALLLLCLGRMRTVRAREKFSARDERENPSYWLWVLPPLLLTGLAVGLRWANDAEIGWWRFGVAVAIPTLIAASSKAIAVTYRYRTHRRWFDWDAIAARAKTIARFLLRRRPGPGELPKREKARAVPLDGTQDDHRTADADGVPSLGHPLLGKPRPEKVGSVRVAGDVLAVAVIAVAGLGLVRSFTAPAVLADDGDATASWVAVAVGIAVATVVWPLANRTVRCCLRRLAGRRRGRIAWLAQLADWARRGEMGGKSVWWPWLAAGAPFLIADAFLLLMPLRTTHWLGVLGTTVIATGTLAVTLAVLAYLAQNERPLPLFRMIRLNVTPVLSLIAVVVLIGAVVDSGSLVHEIRHRVPDPAAPRQSAGTTPQQDRASLLEELQSWLDDPATKDCAVPANNGGTTGAEGPVRVEPIILVAAAGGGIRAAWWTEHALADLAATRCGRHDVFAVSSVSGGSVGMAVLDSEPPARHGESEAHATARARTQASTDIAKIAGPDALAAGIDGLLLHDMMAGLTGIDPWAAQMPPDQPFGDRADLIESAWQSEDRGLDQWFPLDRPVLPWRLLFNSTDARQGCRAVIADGRVLSSPSSPGATSLTCDLRSAVPGGGSFDFFGKLRCLDGNITTATAAMLSARFPYITPSGVVRSCGGKGAPAGQFVDGGYVDSSGLITVADLIPGLTGALRLYNAAALAQALRAPPGQPVTLVVPVVMYLGNSPRPVPVNPTASLIQELYVPIDASSAATTQLSTSDTLLQRVLGMLRDGMRKDEVQGKKMPEYRQWLECTPDLAGCSDAIAAAEKTVPYQVIFVSPRKEPRISAPLGWVLSKASRDALDEALSKEEAAVSRCLNTPQPDVCQPGVGRMADLLQLIRGDTGPR